MELQPDLLEQFTELLAELAAEDSAQCVNRQEEAAAYQIQVARDELFNGIILDKTLQQPELSTETPLEPGTYYVRIRSIDSDRQTGSFSQVAQYDVEKPRRFPYEIFGVGAILLLLLL